MVPQSFHYGPTGSLRRLGPHGLPLVASPDLDGSHIRQSTSGPEKAHDAQALQPIRLMG